ncbi:hypothetical protein EON81_03765 [bacterium]|nr:MAG: hypothetical protein EON81_03765 [bacterium]
MTSERRKKITRRSLIAGGIAGAGAIGGWLEHDALKVEHQNVYPIGYAGPTKKIAFLTDPHISSSRDRDRALRAVELAAAEKPDLLLLGGDYVTRRGGFREHDLHDFFQACALVAPAAGILGNHDYDHKDWPARLKWHFANAGIPLLINREVELAGLRIYGSDDALLGNPKAPEGDPPHVMLLHEPDFVSFAPQAKTLVLSGHTHGGQICLPLGIPLMLPPGGRSAPASGFTWLNGRCLYVSRGIGTTSLPFRTFCRPEVTILHLKTVPLTS